MHGSESEQEYDMLAEYFDKSASAVRHTCERIEQDIARPCFNYLLTAFRKRPIRSTFIAFYLALSALPVLSFLGFSIFIFATAIFFALSASIFVAASAVGFFGFWLASALVCFAVVSFNLTLAGIGIYLTAQFVIRARQEGSRTALEGFARDVRAQFTFPRERGRKASPKPLQESQTAADEINVRRQEIERGAKAKVDMKDEGEGEGDVTQESDGETLFLAASPAKEKLTQLANPPCGLDYEEMPEEEIPGLPIGFD